MRSVKQYLASALIVSMIASAVPLTAVAEEAENPIRQWVLNEDGDWNFYNGKGKLVTSQDRVVGHKWYSFDENGRMFENELFTSPENIPEESEDGTGAAPDRFAYPDGHLAKKGEWLFINDDDGSLHSHDSSCFGNGCGASWYFTVEETDVNADAASNQDYTLGRIVSGEEIKDGDSYYRFDKDGRMYSEEFAEVKVEDSDEPRWSYYRHQGQKVVDKWIQLGSYWCHFDSEGYLSSYAKAKTTADGAVDAEIESMIERCSWIASASNARALSVETVEPAEDELEVVFGETYDLVFDVALASDSNAKEQSFTLSRHDIWMPDSKAGTAGKRTWTSTGEHSGTITVSYTPYAAEQISLFIDGVKSAPITLRQKEITTLEDAKGTVANLLTAWDNNAVVIASDVIEILMDVLEGANEEILKGIKEVLRDNQEYLADLEAAYAMENGVLVEGADISDGAKALFPEDEDEFISATGLAFSGSNGSKVKLQVTVGNADDLDEAGLSDSEAAEVEGKLRVAFEIVGMDGEEEMTLEFPVRVTISKPDGISKNGLKLYHIHDGNAEQVDVDWRGNKGSFMTDSFSTWVFVGDEEQSGSEGDSTIEPDTDDIGYDDDDDDSSSGSSSSRSSDGGGLWFMDAIGWWYRNPDGSYPINTWKYLPYNQRSEWYHFDEQGYARTGWFTDTDGRMYYLNPISNGFKGMMLTGWYQIDGFWYYFNEASDGFKGALLTDTVTPDGYRVNGKGQRVE